jgi:hypothetical protein
MLAIEGCGSAPTASSPVTPPSEPASTAAVALARRDLADHTGVPADQIVVATVTPATWPDGSLGCPKPGIMYSQIVTPGYRIVLQVRGQTYEYHSDGGSHVAPCSPPPSQ